MLKNAIKIILDCFMRYKMIIKKIVFLFVLLVVPAQVLADDNVSTIVNFTASDNKLDLQPYIQILADPDHSLRH